MATKPLARQAHIRRYIGTNKKGEKLTDLWADMYRIDSYVTTTYGAVGPNEDSERVGGTTVMRTVHWHDTPGEVLPSDTFEIVKLCSPDEDPDNPEEWIEIPAMTQVSTNSSLLSATGSGDDQVKRTTFHNPVKDDDRGSQREGYIIKLTHFDTTMDDKSDLKEGGIISLKDYEKKKSSEDKDQYVYSTITLKYVLLCSHQNPNGVGDDQLVRRLTHNEFLVDEYKLTGADTNKVQAPPFNPPWIWDPLQCLINWAGGSLAVEFQNRSNITIKTKLPTTRKFLMAFWFRVPHKTLIAARDEYLAWVETGDPRPKLTGMIPLVTFGQKPIQKQYELRQIGVGTFPLFQDRLLHNGHTFIDSTVGVVPPHTFTEGQQVFTDATKDNLDPCYIAVDCTQEIPRLSVNIVLPNSNKPTIEGSWPKTVAWSTAESRIGNNFDFSTDGSWPHSSTPPFNLLPAFTITQTSDMTGSQADVVLGNRPETFRTLPIGTVGDGNEFGRDLVEVDGPYTDGQEVTADHWHCVILGADFTTDCITFGTNGDIGSTGEPHTQGSRTTLAPTMFLAYDDKNLTGKKLSAYYPDGYIDQNAVLSVNGFYIASDRTFSGTSSTPDTHGNLVTATQTQAVPSYTLECDPIALNDAAFAFPATTDVLDSVKRVEMGEFQMFLGATADPAEEELRRAVVTKEGKPENMAVLWNYMGRRADIILHGSANWKNAKDTGAIALRSDPPTPKGITIGDVKTYRPSPSLFGDQGIVETS